MIEVHLQLQHRKQLSNNFCTFKTTLKSSEIYFFDANIVKGNGRNDPLGPDSVLFFIGGLSKFCFSTDNLRNNPI